MLLARGLRYGATVLVLVTWSGCEAGSSVEGATTTASAAPGWQRVAYEAIRFDVPSDWPVTRTSEWFEFECATLAEVGVFLAPSGPIAAVSCPGTEEYAPTLHVAAYDPELAGAPPAELEASGAEVEGSGADLRWTLSTSANRWHDVTFPRRGVRLVFYEVDDATYERILGSVTGARD